MMTTLRAKALQIWDRLPLQAKPPVLYFMHIPKTAGTSVDAMLRTRFRAEQANQTFAAAELMKMSNQEFAKLDYISGHLQFGYYLNKLTGRPIHTVVFLREPRALLMSIYKQVSFEKNDPMHAYVKANCPDMDSFFHDPVMSDYIVNFQSRYIAHSERRFDLKEINKIRRAAPAEIPGIMKDVLDRHDAKTPPGPKLIQIALERLRSCWFIGLTERLDESMNELAAKLGWPPFPPAPKLNQSSNRKGPADLSASLRRRIDELTALDRVVYEETARQFSSVQPNRLAA